MAAVGFAIKSGWAAFVVVDRVGKAARVLESRRIELCDPAFPESKQPYHDGFATMRRESPRLTRLLQSVREYGGASVREAIQQACRTHGRLEGAGVVVGSLIDPSTIGNEHIRIHAMEGQLFRTIVSAAAEKCRVRCAVWRERDLPNVAPRLSAPEERPWRKEQKQAALAAWLVLHGEHPPAVDRRPRRSVRAER